MKEKFEDTKGVIRSCKSKDRQYNGAKRRRTDNTMVPKEEGQTIQWCQKKKEQTTIYKTLHRKLRVNSGALEG
jgi:hypothetical protein